MELRAAAHRLRVPGSSISMNGSLFLEFGGEIEPISTLTPHEKSAQAHRFRER
jgi:hypothetical protein